MVNPIFVEFWASMVYRKLMALDEVKPAYRDAVEQYILDNYPND